MPECEILVPSMAVKNFIRTGEFFKITSAMETGADHGMYTFQRYQTWLENKKKWHLPTADEKAESDPAEASPALLEMSAPFPAQAASVKTEIRVKESPSVPGGKPAGPIEIEPVEGGLDQLLKNFEKK